jgi:Tfp pilus assembly protein PilO
MNTALRQLAAQIRRAPLVAANVVILLILGVANYFLWQRQQDLNLQHTEVKRSGEAVMLSLAGQARVSGELVRVQDALKVIDQNLVAEGDLAENLGYFYQMETISHVRLSQLNQLNALPVQDGNPYKSIPFTLRASGSFAQIMAFLHAMETGPRLLRIKSFGLGRAELKTSALSLDLTVELLGSP